MNFLLAPLFGAMDRVFGSDVNHGRRYAAVGAGLSGIIAGWPGLLLGVLWMGYRSVGMFGGSAAPRKDQYLNSLLRHAIGILPFVVVAAIFALPLSSAFIAGGAYALAATAIAIFHGLYRDKKEADGEDIGKINTYLEVARGVAFGAAAAWLI